MGTEISRRDVPTYQHYMNPILRVLRTQEESVSNDRLDALVASEMELSDALLLVPHDEKSDAPEAYYRMAWARTYLKKVGLIENPQRGAFDSPEVRKFVETVLEGGRTAFELRRKKYGF